MESHSRSYRSSLGPTWRLVIKGDFMTGSHAHHEEELRGLLRSKGLRATSVRMAVLCALHDQQAPMTHEQVMDSLSDGAYDRATVWRILSDLAEAGLMRRMDLGDRVWRYELIDACRAVEDDHAHFLCEACGSVSCLPPLELRVQGGQLPEVLRGADVRVRVTGTCVACTSS